MIKNSACIQRDCKYQRAVSLGIVDRSSQFPESSVESVSSCSVYLCEVAVCCYSRGARASAHAGCYTLLSPLVLAPQLYHVRGHQSAGADTTTISCAWTSVRWCWHHSHIMCVDISPLVLAPQPYRAWTSVRWCWQHSYIMCVEISPLVLAPQPYRAWTSVSYCWHNSYIVHGDQSASAGTTAIPCAWTSVRWC
jgi:hypothetical protein